MRIVPYERLWEFFGAGAVMAGTLILSFTMPEGWVLRLVGESLLLVWSLWRPKPYWWLGCLAFTGVLADINGIWINFLK